VYVASLFSKAIVAFARGASGGLTPAGCIQNTGGTACTDVGGTAAGLDGASGVAVSPDGTSVYVASLLSDAIALFVREIPPPTTSTSSTVAACEALSGLAALLCRCATGLAVPACAAQTLPSRVTTRFTAACAAVDAVQDAGGGRKARKAAGRAAKRFKKARRRVLATRVGTPLPAPCREALAVLLASTRATALALKGTF